MESTFSSSLQIHLRCWAIVVVCFYLILQLDPNQGGTQESSLSVTRNPCHPHFSSSFETCAQDSGVVGAPTSAVTCRLSRHLHKRPMFSKGYRPAAFCWAKCCLLFSRSKCQGRTAPTRGYSKIRVVLNPPLAKTNIVRTGLPCSGLAPQRLYSSLWDIIHTVPS